MSGEASKRSGEIGEELAQKLLNLIGWGQSLSAIKIPCAFQEKHETTSHGDDKLFIYNNPFIEGTTDVVHVSVKHKTDGYKKTAQGIRNELKNHLTELNNIVKCAGFSPDVARVIASHHGKPRKIHRGLLVWLHSDGNSLERDIRQDIGDIQLSKEHSTPIFLIDSGRASFIYHAIRHYQSKQSEEYTFYYPRLGNAMSADNERSGKYLPLELIASDVIPIRGCVDNKPVLHLYIREKFSTSALKKAYALARDFGDAWVTDIHIGFEDYNETTHRQFRDEALLAFENIGNVVVFSYKANLLNFLEG